MPRWTIAFGLALLAAVYVSSFFLTADSDNVLCALRAATGVPCPLCGMSRAFISISHGEFARAVSFHPLSPFAYAAGVILTMLMIGELSGSKRASPRLLGRPLRLVAICAVIFAIYWAVRLLHLWHTGALAQAFRASPLGRIVQ